MSFAPFVGVNHHRQLILLGVSCCLPKTQIPIFGSSNVDFNACQINQCKAMQNIIQYVLPNARHR